MRTGNPPDNWLFEGRSVPMRGSGRVSSSSRPCRVDWCSPLHTGFQDGLVELAEWRIPVPMCVTKGRSDGRRSERTVATGPARAGSALGVRRDGGRPRLRAGTAHSGWPLPWCSCWARRASCSAGGSGTCSRCGRPTLMSWGTSPPFPRMSAARLLRCMRTTT